MKACLRRIVPQGVLSSLVALCVVLAAATAAADTHYVSLAGHAVSPYANWYDAATSIQPALAVVASGDVILVSNGVYTLATTITWDTSWQYKSVTIASLYGSAATTIDGTGMTPNVNWPYGLYLNSPTTICGFTFTNFTPGAIVFRDGTGTNLHTFTDCVVAGNQSAGISTVSGYHSAILSNCVIRGNAAGGIASVSTYLQVDNSVISENRGGGVSASPSLGVVIRNSTISGNTNSSEGGGIYCTLGSIINCTIVSNYTGSMGGGVSGGSGTIIENCTVAANTASQGAGIYTYGIVRNCVLTGNRAGNVGGGIRGWPGTVVSNCTVVGNYATNGAGGIYLGSFIRNCLIVNNTAGAGVGGGINCNGSVANCTIVGNSASGNGGGVCGSGTSINSIVYFNTGAGSYSNFISQVFSNSCAAPLPAGAGNIATNPMLANMPADCRLLKGSPCINTGTNQSWMSGAVDVGGHARIVDGTVDMGAYEWYPKGVVVKFR